MGWSVPPTGACSSRHLRRRGMARSWKIVDVIIVSRRYLRQGRRVVGHSYASPEARWRSCAGGLSASGPSGEGRSHSSAAVWIGAIGGSPVGMPRGELHGRHRALYRRNGLPGVTVRAHPRRKSTRTVCPQSDGVWVEHPVLPAESYPAGVLTAHSVGGASATPRARAILSCSSPCCSSPLRLILSNHALLHPCVKLSPVKARSWIRPLWVQPGCRTTHAKPLCPLGSSSIRCSTPSPPLACSAPGMLSPTAGTPTRGVARCRETCRWLLLTSSLSFSKRYGLSLRLHPGSVRKFYMGLLRS